MDPNPDANAAPADFDAKAPTNGHTRRGSATGPAKGHPATTGNRTASGHRTTAGPTIADVGSTTDVNAHRGVSVIASPWQRDV